MSNLAEKILDGLVNSSFESDEALRPKLLYNNQNKGNTILANIEDELKKCDSFWFSVAFITSSGLILIKDLLKELEAKDIKGKILTTDYLTFSEPKALEDLIAFRNIEIRVCTEEAFHTKGYMFSKGDKKTFIVGSSNFTQNT